MARESRKEKKARLAIEQQDENISNEAKQAEEAAEESTVIGTDGANSTTTTDVDPEAPTTTGTAVLKEEAPEEEPEKEPEAEEPKEVAEEKPDEVVELRNLELTEYTFVPRGTAPNGFKQMSQLLFDVIGVKLFVANDEEGEKRLALIEAWNTKNSRYGKIVKASEVK